jgi:hypothetical protein
MDQFTVYSFSDTPEFEKGKPYLVYEVRDSKGQTEFLVATKDGSFV